jgi:poly(hydroxyalkanoate) depolymerase family esterase
MRAAAASIALCACAAGAPMGSVPDAADPAADPDAAAGADPDAAIGPAADAAADAASFPPYPPVDFEPMGTFSGLDGYLHVPPAMGIGEPRPLILVLHGCWEDAAVHAANSGWDALADARRLYVVHAEEPAQIQQCLDWWSAIAQGGGGDSAALLAMIDAAAADYSVDDERVYVAGFSSGGAVAINLVARFPERFAGAVVHAGLPFAGYTGTDVGTLGYIFSEHDQTPAARAAAMPGAGPYPPVVAFVGATDSTVHPSYTRELVEQWTAAQGADQTPDLEGLLKPDHDGHLYRRYQDGDGRLLIATIAIDGMSHGYAVDPGGDGADAGGAATASLPGKPVYGKDVGLWSAYWAAEVLGL